MAQGFTADQMEPGSGCGVIAFLGVMVLLFAGLGWLEYADTVTWRERTACEAKRMEAHRRPYSLEIACVPAYRATRNDTLAIQGLPR